MSCEAERGKGDSEDKYVRLWPDMVEWFERNEVCEGGLSRGRVVRCGFNGGPEILASMQ